MSTSCAQALLTSMILVGGCADTSDSKIGTNDSDSGTDTNGNTDTDADSDSDTDTDIDTDSDTDTETNTDSATGTDTTTECGDAECSIGETAGTCPEDCPPICDDGFCTHDEGPIECPEDCEGCGDSVCDTDENFCTCADDCDDLCGDTCCSESESFCTCTLDCDDICGDGCCSASEDSTICPADCDNPCGDLVCGEGEDYCNCPTDCTTACEGGCCFYEPFTGSTLFTEFAYPYGDPDICGTSNEVNFSNTGNEHRIQMGCYDEAELRIDLDLPLGDYTITVDWRTGVDPHSYSGCEYTYFDDQYGATCEVPNRIIAVNDNVIYENTGQKTNYSETTDVPYTGTIDSLVLGVDTAGYEQDYNTWYNYVLITSP